MSGGYDAIVLAGGHGARLGGVAKPQLTVGDATLLDRVLTAVLGAGKRIVVGPRQAIPGGVVLVQEQPAGAGPVAALAAGLVSTSAEVVVVLAADLPFLSADLIEALVAGLGDPHDVALLVDENGRDQNLLGAWRVDPLRQALAELDPLPGRAMKQLVELLRLNRVQVGLPDDAPAPWTDVDTAADLESARAQPRPESGTSPENARTARAQK